MRENKMKITLPLSLQCGCRLFEDELNQHWTFKYCPLHNSAHGLLYCLKAMRDCPSMEEAQRNQLFEKANTLIAQAEGK